MYLNYRCQGQIHPPAVPGEPADLLVSGSRTPLRQERAVLTGAWPGACATPPAASQHGETTAPPPRPHVVSTEGSSLQALSTGNASPQPAFLPPSAGF